MSYNTYTQSFDANQIDDTHVEVVGKNSSSVFAKLVLLPPSHTSVPSKWFVEEFVYDRFNAEDLEEITRILQRLDDKVLFLSEEKQNDTT